MKNTFPEYYKKFSCIADKCPDTCCAGWDVVIDDESFDVYSALNTDYGNKIRSLITVDGDGDRIFVSKNGNCPFLLENGLCDMYIHLGHGKLCRTCRNFPRFTNCFGARIETGVSLSCPEAARLILEKPEPAEFITEETDGAFMPADFDASLYFMLVQTRKKAINILQQRNFPFTQRLCSFLEFSQAVQECIKSGDYDAAAALDGSEFTGKNSIDSPARAKRTANKIFSDFLSLEFINDNFSKLITEAKRSENKGFHTPDYELEHLAVYFVFRYFITAAYDGDLLTKAKFTAASMFVINRLFSSQNATEKAKRTETAQKFSKETEHSLNNMNFLLETAKKSHYYSIDNLINIFWGEEI